MSYTYNTPDGVAFSRMPVDKHWALHLASVQLGRALTEGERIAMGTDWSKVHIAEVDGDQWIIRELPTGTVIEVCDYVFTAAALGAVHRKLVELGRNV